MNISKKILKQIILEELASVLESMPNFDKGPWPWKQEGLPDFKKGAPDFKKQPFHDDASKHVAKISQALKDGSLWKYENPDKPGVGAKQIKAVRLGNKGQVDMAFLPSGFGSLEVWDFIDLVKRGSISPIK